MTDNVCECGVPFEDHLGLIGTCRHLQETRHALIDLIAACESAMKTEKADVEALLKAIQSAKRSVLP